MFTYSLKKYKQYTAIMSNPLLRQILSVQIKNPNKNHPESEKAVPWFLSHPLNIHTSTNKARECFKRCRRQKGLHFLTFKCNGSAYTVTKHSLFPSPHRVQTLILYL